MKRLVLSVLLAVVMLGIGLKVGHAATLGSNPTARWNQMMDQYAGLVARERHVEATEVAEGAVRLAERIFGAETVEYARALDRLASDRLATGQFAQAQRFYEESTTLHLNLLGDADPAVATALVHESRSHLARGDPEQAETLLRRALRIHKTHVTRDDPTGLQIVVLLCNTLVAQEKAGAAEALFLDEISRRERELGGQHPSIATLQVALANHYFARERWEEAKHLYQQALATRELTLDVDNPLIPTTLLLLDRLYTLRGAEFEAENSYDRAADLIARWYILEPSGPGSQATADSSPSTLTDEPKSKPRSKRQIAAPNNVIQMAESLQRQAIAYLNVKEFGRAISLLEQSVNAYELALDRSDIRLAVTLEKLAELFNRAGRRGRGSELAARAQRIRTVQVKFPTEGVVNP